MAPLSSEQGYVLALHWPSKFGLPVELQRLIWADVTKNYYRRLGDTLDPAFYARVLQAAVRRLRALVGSYQNINFSMLAAKNATRGSLVWKHRFDNLHERRIKYRVATSPKWHWGVVGQYALWALPVQSHL